MKVGVIYTTFYDLELLESSINSIKSVVSEIVMVHQKIGFNKKSEPKKNEAIINDLLDRNIVNKIIYYEGTDKNNGMIEKANIGLDYLRKMKCTHVLQLAPDMTYNANELLFELNEMERLQLDTVYFPIKTFYYDRLHYFIDTYYFQGIHRINKRNYERCKSTYLCDPQAKMQEGKYKMSKYFVLHYSFLKDHYGNKLQNSIRSIGNAEISNCMERIYNHLMNWRHGQNALVFQNDMSRNGKVICAEIKLQRIHYKIALCIPIFERPEITDFVFNHYKNITDKFKDKLNIITVIAGSEEQTSRTLAEKYNFVYIETPNNPLAQKHNNLYLKAKEFNPDACIKVDSDTIISEQFFDWYIRLLDQEYDYADVLDIYIAIDKHLCYTKGYVGKREGEGTGVSRFISKRLLDIVDWKLWGDSTRDYGFDKIMTDKIKTFDLKRTSINCADIGGYCIDIKCNKNLTPFSDFTFDAVFDIDFFDFNFAPVKKWLLKTNDIKLFENEYTVIIPTMWYKMDYFFVMLEKYEANESIKEIIIIDNRPDGRPELNFSKVKILSKGTNIMINPAWNWAVNESKTDKIILANDDIIIDKFDELLQNLQLHKGAIIGPGSFNKNDTKLTIKKGQIERTWGFGTFMVMYKSDYKQIQEYFKLWVGDDIQYYSNIPYLFTGINVQTPMSETIKKTGLRPLGLLESEFYKNHCNKDGTINGDVPDKYRQLGFKTLNNYFDAIYCITVCEQRYNKAKEHFDKFKLKVIRHEGTMGNNVINAIHKSHRSVWEDAVKNGYNKVLIFEDDVILSNKVNNYQFEQLPFFDCLWLGASQVLWRSQPTQPQYKSDSNTLGMFAYCITLEFAQKLLSKKSTKAVDVYVASMAENGLVIYPNIIIADVSKSTYQNERNMIEHAKKMKWDLNMFDNIEQQKTNGFTNVEFLITYNSFKQGKQYRIRDRFVEDFLRKGLIKTLG